MFPGWAAATLALALLVGQLGGLAPQPPTGDAQRDLVALKTPSSVLARALLRGDAPRADLRGSIGLHAALHSTYAVRAHPRSYAIAMTSLPIVELGTLHAHATRSRAPPAA